MQTLRLQSEIPLDFPAASRLADAVAASLVGGSTTCLSWYDRERDHECPAHASECHDGTCTVPGYVEYAESRGASLRVEIDDGRFVFCYIDVSEFD